MDTWIQQLAPAKALFSLDIWDAVAPRKSPEEAMLDAIVDGSSYNAVRRYIEAANVEHTNAEGNQAIHLAAR